MPSYTAPVDDMMFLFDKLRNNKKYNEIEKYMINHSIELKAAKMIINQSKQKKNDELEQEK